MISFRYHVVSLVAVLLALAVGVVLGGGPLQRSASAGEPSSADVAAAAEQRVKALQDELALSDGYTRATEKRVLAGALRGRAVTLLTLPDVDQEAVRQVSHAVGIAGGTVASRVALGADLLDAANRQLVTTLAAQLQQSGHVRGVPAGATGYEQMGALLAHAVATRKDAGGPVDQQGESILAGLATAKLVAGAQRVTRRGSVVLVLAGDPAGSTEQRDGAGSIISALSTGLDAGSDGAVVAGPPASGRRDGVVGAIRADAAVRGRVSTVDVLGSAPGPVATVLTAAAQGAGRTGHYGSAAAPDGPLPGAAG